MTTRTLDISATGKYKLVDAGTYFAIVQFDGNGNRTGCPTVGQEDYVRKQWKTRFKVA